MIPFAKSRLRLADLRQAVSHVTVPALLVPAGFLAAYAAIAVLSVGWVAVLAGVLALVEAIGLGLVYYRAASKARDGRDLDDYLLNTIDRTRREHAHVPDNVIQGVW